MSPMAVPEISRRKMLIGVLGSVAGAVPLIDGAR
jgi:hypothetical protein